MTNYENLMNYFDTIIKEQESMKTDHAICMHCRSSGESCLLQNEDGSVRCTNCGATFFMKDFNQNEIEKIISDMLNFAYTCKVLLAISYNSYTDLRKMHNLRMYKKLTEIINVIDDLSNPNNELFAPNIYKAANENFNRFDIFNTDSTKAYTNNFNKDVSFTSHYYPINSNFPNSMFNYGNVTIPINSVPYGVISIDNCIKNVHDYLDKSKDSVLNRNDMQSILKDLLEICEPIIPLLNYGMKTDLGSKKSNVMGDINHILIFSKYNYILAKNDGNYIFKYTGK